MQGIGRRYDFARALNDASPGMGVRIHAGDWLAMGETFAAAASEKNAWKLTILAQRFLFRYDCSHNCIDVLEIWARVRAFPLWYGFQLC